jgi:catechol 2,3-dioxygenase-like lactoylglutathione lyase family enzyme
LARLEHVNITVADPDAAASLFCDLFDWRIRWSGTAMETGRSVHVGNAESYVALFSYGRPHAAGEDSHRTLGGLNHIAVVVDDLDATEGRVRRAGLIATNHASYEPGRRFYVEMPSGIEVEVVSYA